MRSFARRSSTRLWFVLALLLAMGAIQSAHGQQQIPTQKTQQAPTSQPEQQAPSSQTQSQPPTLVNVIATDKHTGAAAKELVADDFEIFDDRAPVAISSIAGAGSGGLRPLSVWLVVQCPEARTNYNWYTQGSGFLRGKAEALGPELQHLSALDTVGVAHWCDDGRTDIDLLPSADRASPIDSLNAVLNRAETPIVNSLGEKALHDVLVRVRDAAVAATPGALPVIIFFYGDDGVMRHADLDDLLDRPLGPMPLIYGINNGVVPVQKIPWLDVYLQSHVVHFLADSTGGDFLPNVHGDYAKEFRQIIRELRGRYELGFIPSNASGKPHGLKVRFKKDARPELKSVQLRVAPEFLALTQNTSMEDAHPELLSAVQSATAYKEIIFDASGKFGGAKEPALFRLFVSPDSLSWTAIGDGARKAALAVGIAGVSSQGATLGEQIRQFEVQKSKVEQASAARSGVVLAFSYAVPGDVERVRFVIRDAGNGHLGSFELPATRIAAAPADSAQ